MHLFCWLAIVFNMAKNQKSIDELIKEAELARLIAEKDEIKIRTDQYDTKKEKRVKYTISTLVPIITAIVVLTAAFVELRQVRDEKEELAAEKADFVKLKESDFTKNKVSKSISLLADNKENHNTDILLYSLDNALLSGIELDDEAIRIVFDYLLDTNLIIKKYAREIVLKSQSEVVGQLITEQLQYNNGLNRYEFLPLLKRLNSNQGIKYVFRLINHSDPIISGSASILIASKIDSLKNLDISIKAFESGSDNKRNFVETLLLTDNDNIRTKTLLILAQNLKQDENISLGSAEGLGLSYLLTLDNLHPQQVPITNEMIRNNNFPLENRLIGAALIKNHSFIKETFNTLNGKEEISPSTIDFLVELFPVAPPSINVSSIENVNSLNPRLSKYMNLKTLPASTITKWLEDIKDNFRFRQLRKRLLEELLLKDEKKAVYSMKNVLGYNEFQIASFLAKSNNEITRKEAFDIAKGILETENDQLSHFYFLRIIQELNKTQNTNTILESYRDKYMFKFYSNLDQIVKIDSVKTLEILMKDLNSYNIDTVQFAAMLVDIDKTQGHSHEIIQALNHCLDSISRINKTSLIDDPELYADYINLSLLFLSNLTNNPDFESFINKFCERIKNLPVVPYSDYSPCSIKIDDGSFAIHGDLGPLFDKYLPEFYIRLSTININESNRLPEFYDHSYKILLSKILESHEQKATIHQ